MSEVDEEELPISEPPDHIRCSIGNLSHASNLFNAAQATAAALGATERPHDLYRR